MAQNDEDSGDAVDVKTFDRQIHLIKLRLHEEHKDFDNELRERDQSQALEALDWAELEKRYHEAIEPIARAESELYQRFIQLFQHFQLWLQVSSEQESERAFKRYDSLAPRLFSAVLTLFKGYAHVWPMFRTQKTHWRPKKSTVGPSIESNTVMLTPYTDAKVLSAFQQAMALFSSQ